MQEFEHLDYYELLGISPTASIEEIKRAYRQQVSRYHPDRFSNAPPAEQTYASQRTQRINEAYRVLSNFDSRNAYNRDHMILVGKRGSDPASKASQFDSADDSPHRNHQAELYEQARAHLEAGRHMQAAATLRELQKINPFYRDSAALLAQAESGSTQPAKQEPAARKSPPPPPPGAQSTPATAAPNRRLLLFGGLGIFLIAGVVGLLFIIPRTQSSTASEVANTPPSQQTSAVASQTTPNNIAAAATDTPDDASYPAPETEPTIAPNTATPTPEMVVGEPTPSMTATTDARGIPVAEVTPSPTMTPEPSSTPSVVASPSPTMTPEPTSTPSPTYTPIPTMTPEPTSTPAPTDTAAPVTEGEPTSTPAPTSTPSPTNTPSSLKSDTSSAPSVQDIEQGEIVQSFTFTDAQGWADMQGNTWSVGPQDGTYQIGVSPGSGNIWSYRTNVIGTSYSIGTDVQVDNGGAAGLVLHFIDGDNYLSFMVNPSQRSYQIEHESGGQKTVVQERRNSAVKTGNMARNRLVARLDGTDMQLFVNDTMVLDDTLDMVQPTNKYGLVAVATEQAAIARFDNLELRTIE